LKSIAIFIEVCYTIKCGIKNSQRGAFRGKGGKDE
jgi:hypothetical protein